MDITASDHLQLDSRQAQTPENQWLRKHCADYGFILRYPKHKEKVTGYMYESWHFRYVGWPHAGLMAQRGVTLEELCEQLGSLFAESDEVFRQRIEKQNQKIT